MFIKNLFQNNEWIFRVLWDSSWGSRRKGTKLAATWSTGYHRWHNGVSPETRVKRDNGSVHISGIHCPIDPQSVTLGGCETSKRGGGNKGSTPLGMTTIDLWMEDACHYNGVAHSSVQLFSPSTNSSPIVPN